MPAAAGHTVTVSSRVDEKCPPQQKAQRAVSFGPTPSDSCSVINAGLSVLWGEDKLGERRQKRWAMQTPTCTRLQLTSQSICAQVASGSGKLALPWASVLRLASASEIIRKRTWPCSSERTAHDDRAHSAMPRQFMGDAAHAGLTYVTTSRSLAYGQTRSHSRALCGY